jgi:D-arabinose 1-dehydrogenase-like Zn-dependent alcohol dehydrogenase
MSTVTPRRGEPDSAVKPIQREIRKTFKDFAARHGIAPQTEHFPMSQINQAFARLESGKAHYRIVLDADF